MYETTDATFLRDVSQPGITLVDIWSPSCPACLQLEPLLARFAEQNPDVRVLKLNAYHNRQTARQFARRGVPTLLVLVDGELRATYVGNPGTLGTLAGLVRNAHP